MRIRVNPDSEGPPGRLRLQFMEGDQVSLLWPKPRDYRGIVKHIVDIACARRGAPVPIAELCRVAAISQRTLRNAFHAVHGVTPHRYLRRQRMIAARQMLLAGNSDGRTVTAIATDFGFFELGRFAVEYRSLFGESPSATLRRSTGMTHPLSRRGAVAIEFARSSASASQAHNEHDLHA